MLGKTLSGRYQIIKHLAGGGFGQTYLAEDQQLPGNPKCVVKQLKPKASDSLTLEVARRLFDREVQVLYRLGSHDQIPQLLAHFEDEQEFYLVQEFIEGDELKQELPLGKQLSEDLVLVLLQDVLEILVFVHQQDVIHRDIKPSNLIRRKQDGKLVLIDFGAVKEVGTQTVSAAGETTLTVVIGSPGYMANEQLSGKPRFSSDIYAVGMLGIQALTGLPPSQLPEDSKTSEILWRDRLSVGKRYTVPLLDVLDKMVRYDYRQRYQTAIEALQALQQFNTDVVTEQMPSPTDNVRSLPTDSLVPVTQTVSIQISSAVQPINQNSSVATSVMPKAPPKPAQKGISRIPNKAPLLIRIGAGIATALVLTVGIFYFQKSPSIGEKPQKIALIRTLPGHAGGVTSIALSPDGQFLVSSSLDQTIKIRNLRTKEIIHTLTGHSGYVYSVAISSDGQTLVTGSADQTIKVWNLQTGELLRTLDGHSGEVYSVAINPDGRTLVSGSQDKTIKVWNLQTGELVRTLTGVKEGLDEGVRNVAISPDGQTLVSSNVYDINVWNLETGELRRTFGGHIEAVRAIAISSNGETLASGSPDGTTKLWSLQTGELLNTFPHGSRLPNGSFSGGVYAVALSPDGQMLLSGSGIGENSLKLWNLRTGELIRTLTGHSNTIFSIVISPDEQTIYSSSLDGTIKVWRVP
ncbi:serine/threonine-protein kinase [Coleofasciculus sp. FACHB-1120]|uniref:serine/threonine-protein kinase n=1 Tax=Coleofasciculus sp. FACHB-1120 TaxID=2692783 RepID=UPI0016844962|nr:serine/threonine-protein kinase [Coleofasciculus sp. FACHB-1120]MBD2740685.1 serine/threonine protein kinase [Coleofasciculus sp. FACHB-1120]